MADYGKLAIAVQQIKDSSEQLSAGTAAAGQSLIAQSQAIGAMAGGISQSLQEAAMAVGVAGNTLTHAAAAMTTLAGSCDRYLVGLKR